MMSLIKIRKVPILDSWRWLFNLRSIIGDGYRVILSSFALMCFLSFISPDIDFVERGYLTVIDLINTFVYPFIPIFLTGFLLSRSLGINNSGLSIVFNLNIIFYSLITTGLIVISLILFLNINPEIERLSDAAFDKLSIISVDEDTAKSEDLVRLREIDREYKEAAIVVEGASKRILWSIVAIFLPLILFILYSLMVTLPLAISTKTGILKSYWLSIKNLIINPASTVFAILVLVLLVISLEFIVSLVGSGVDDLIYPLMLIVSCLITVAFTKSIITLEVKR